MAYQKLKKSKVTHRSPSHLLVSKFEQEHFGIQSFLNTAIDLGHVFLSCGGPVSRLETLITRAGEKKGYETSVQATPSSLLISVYFSTSGKSFVRSIRLESSGISLYRLRVADKLLQQFSKNLKTDQTIKRYLRRLIKVRPKKPPLRRHLALSGLGLSASLLYGATPLQSLVAGGVTSLTFLIVDLLKYQRSTNQFFEVFLLSSTSLLISMLISFFFGWPSVLFSIGTLAYVVPGLLMTTAISEIVDQHYLSGSIRILKSLTVFLVMAMAYFITNDVSSGLGLSKLIIQVQAPWAPTNWLVVKILASGIMVFCFSLEFEAHKKSIPRIFLCGIIGTLTFYFTSAFGQLYFSTFSSSLVIGLLSFRISRHYGHPSQIYSVPSILSLAPGMLAFSSFSQVASSQQTETASLVQAFLVSLSIVFGLIVGRLGTTDDRTL